MKKLITCIFFLCCLAGVSLPASAALQQWSFQANVAQLSGSTIITDQIDSAGFGIGTQIVGTLFVDTNVSDVTPGDDLGFYWNAIIAASILVGNQMGQFSPPPGGFNRVAVEVGETGAMDANAEVGFSVLENLGFAGFVLRFIDSTGSLYTDDSFPDELYSLDDFDPFDASLGFPGSTGFYLFFSDGDNFGHAEAQLTEFTMTPIPLPSALLLFLTSLSLLKSNSSVRRNERSRIT